MNPSTESPESLGVQVKIKPGGTLCLQLSLRNDMQEPLLLRPILEDWVRDDREIFATTNRLFPPYIYLDPGVETGQTLSLEIPIAWQPGQQLTSGLRFPGFHERGIPIHVEIVPPEGNSDRAEVPIAVTFPLLGESDRPRLASDPSTAGIFGLIGGLLDLDRIPAPWLAAELLTLLAQIGEEYAATSAGKELRDRLQTTQLYRNGASAFTQAQLPHWIWQKLSEANATLRDRVGEGHLLEIWERWLFDLAHTDVEIEGNLPTIAISPLFKSGFSEEMGVDGGRWFGAILLGLAAIAPRFASGIEACSARSPHTGVADSATPASYTLSTGLSGLEALPARWLVVELLLGLAGKGWQRSRTPGGEQLLAQLGRTRFFKNGVLAMASAQAPRWLSVSQSAAAAYHASVGGSPGQQGLLYFWEQWLWSVGNCSIPIAPFSGDATCEALGMDGDRWFGAIVLGLAEVSPRLNALLEAIAALPAPAPIPSAPTPTFDDILGEPKSLQR